YGTDPNKCVWNVYSLQRYAPGTEPKVEEEWNQDLTDESFWGKILTQDYVNMAQVQKGMKNKAFKGARPNPKQEIAVLNFHRALEEFLEEGYGA
ncbi:MAG: aromatic ring-hydroxylating dioxygenase subunit alpha, partial [Sphingomonadaceae bacterium]|nr:aromatic ring-hydroxylating dioxygenase subunit alpha [Sphingomonadaceae bacterium]